MDKKEIERERRRQRRLEALGTNDPRCLHCGEDDPACLELHEPGGRDYANLSVIECRNCHRKLEDRRKDHPKRLSMTPTDVESAAHFLDGLADWFELLIAYLRKVAATLYAAARSETPTGGAPT